MAIPTRMPLALLFFITSLVLRVSSTGDYDDGDGDQKPVVGPLPYFCLEEPLIPEIKNIWPCCYRHPPCKRRYCGGVGPALANITDSRQLLGTVDVLVNSTPVSVTSLADLDLERNFISTPLVNTLGLSEAKLNWNQPDVHKIEVSNHTLTVRKFLRLDIRIGVERRLLSDRIFEVIPPFDGVGDEEEIPGLVIGSNLLNIGRGLLINPAFFTNESTAPSTNFKAHEEL